MMSLALQMKFKAAICRRDYVLIFATLLRSIGVQCRVVQSLVCDPKVCPKTELMSLSKKATEQATKKPSKPSSKSSKRKSSRKSVKIPQLDGGDNDVPKRKTRSAKNAKTATPKKLESDEVFSPKVKIAVDSPNRASKAKPAADKMKNGGAKPSEVVVKNRALDKTKAAATLNVFSPRKTRSMSRDQSPKPSTSSAKLSKSSSSLSKKDVEKKKAAPKKDAKDTLKIILPRTTRSRSRSSENPPKKDSTKPNLQKLAVKRKAGDKSEEATAPKIAKVAEASTSKSSSRKREASLKEEIVFKKRPRAAKVSESSEDSSLKYFKLNKSSSSKPSTSKAVANVSKIDRRVLTPDIEKERNTLSLSPRKGKGIDIWVEAYSEKEEKWIAIDVHRGKVDCVDEIVKKATQPLVYVFAWNNDNSIKDVSARYCKDFNTRIRKMRVERQYLNSVLHLFAGVRTARDFKEDDELNKIQFEQGMPKSIAE